MSIWPKSERATEIVSFRVPPSVKRRILDLKDDVRAATMTELFADALNYYAEAVRQTLDVDAELILRTWPNVDRTSAPIEIKLEMPWIDTVRERENEDLTF